MTKEMILSTSDEAAKYVTNIEGWVDRDGRFWGNDEGMARWTGCTHVVCPDCGNPATKFHSRCSDCRDKRASVRYEAMKKVKWDGETPLYSMVFHKYYYDAVDIIDEIAEHDCTIESLQLVICDPIYLKELDEDYFTDELPENEELPEDIADALADFNSIIKAYDHVSWEPGTYAAKDVWEVLK